MNDILRSIKKFGFAEGLFAAACAVVGYVIVKKVTAVHTATPPQAPSPPSPTKLPTSPDPASVVSVVSHPAAKAAAATVPNIPPLPNQPAPTSSDPSLSVVPSAPPMQANPDGSWSNAANTLFKEIGMPHTDLKPI